MIKLGARLLLPDAALDIAANASNTTIVGDITVVNAVKFMRVVIDADMRSIQRTLSKLIVLLVSQLQRST
jgi:hypothetical protein